MMATEEKKERCKINIFRYVNTIARRDFSKDEIQGSSTHISCHNKASLGLNESMTIRL